VSTCSKCNVKIPDGRSYCNAHYQEALTEYQIDMQKYNEQSKLWDSLSLREQNKYHKQAENSALGLYSFFFSLFVGSIIWLILPVFLKIEKIDFLYGVLILIGSVILLTFIPPIKKITGRLARTVFWGAITSGILAIVTYVLSTQSEIVSNHQNNIYIASIVIGFIFSIFREITSGHHASAKPKAPNKPKP